jgi:hypothetical protein
MFPDDITLVKDHPGVPPPLKRGITLELVDDASLKYLYIGYKCCKPECDWYSFSSCNKLNDAVG